MKYIKCLIRVAIQTRKKEKVEKSVVMSNQFVQYYRHYHHLEHRLQCFKIKLGLEKRDPVR